MKKNKNTFNVVVIIVLALLLLFFMIHCFDLKKENSIYKKVMELDISMNDVLVSTLSNADEYYDLASEDYIIGDYLGLVNNCENAREYFLDASQEYREIQVELVNEKGILNVYYNLLDEKIEITNNMYEACEHFESAAKYYEIYYQVGTPFDDSSYDMGTKEIDMMNEKISAHDEAVDRHNDLLAEIDLYFK